MRVAQILLALAVFSPLVGSIASEDQFGIWTQVGFKTVLPWPQGEIEVSGSIDPSDRFQRFTSISAKLNGAEIAIPKKVFSDLQFPSLRSMDVSYDAGDPESDGWRFYIRFSYRLSSPRSDNTLPSAAIVIDRNGHITGRMLRVPGEGHVWNITVDRYDEDGT